MRILQVVLLVGTVFAASPLSGQDDELISEKVVAVLEYAKVGAVVGSLAEAFPAQVESLVPGALEEQAVARLTQVVQTQFAVELLRGYAIEAFVEQADDAMLDDLLLWLPTGASAELDAMVGDEPPSVELMDYAKSLEANPPSQERVQVVAGWAIAQAAADFYAVLSDAHAYATHQMAGALSPDAPTYASPTEAQLQESVEGAFNIALLAFLQRFESAPDELIREATAQYSSESGQWFVEVYTYALDQAIRVAGEMAAVELANP